MKATIQLLELIIKVNFLSLAYDLMVLVSLRESVRRILVRYFFFPKLIILLKVVSQRVDV